MLCLCSKYPTLGADKIVLEIHHEGVFKKGGLDNLEYIGGGYSSIYLADVDQLSYFEVKGHAEDIGF